MSEIIGWLKFTWTNWELWQKTFILAMCLQVIGWCIPGNAGWTISGIGFSIVMFFMLKWFVWESIKSSWAKYKSHRNELLTTIKESDK
jgi:hypothetical protein